MTTQLLFRVLPLLAGACLVTLGTAAGPWPQWRGPEFNGAAPAERPPRGVSSNVLWSVPLPGPGAATPVISGDHVFVASTDRSNRTLVALCHDARTGNRLWTREVAPGTHRDDRSDFAGPSPVTDGQHTWFYYSTGELLCLTMSGAPVWQRNIQKDYGDYAFLWTFSSSPLLFDGRLYLQVLQRDVPVNGRGRKDGPIDSFLLALDPATGKELWRISRPSDARQESREAYSTPIPFLGTSRTEILVTGGDCITGHNPSDGTELWRWGNWNPGRITHWRLVPSPVTGQGIALACAPKGGPVLAFKAGASGTLPAEGFAWRSSDREVSADVPTPLFHQGHFYVLNGTRHTISCVEPASGKVLWTGQLESQAVFDASPTAAADQVYCLNQQGRLFVVAAQPSGFQLLETADFGQEGDRRVRSSVAIADNRLFLRTDTRLLCIGDRRSTHP